MEYLQRSPLASSMDCSVQYFSLCGLLCLLASIMLLLKKSHLILWLFFAKLVCCLWLFPSIPQLEVCFSVSLWCFLCLPCLQATYVVPFYTWRPSKMCERKWDQSGCLEPEAGRQAKNPRFPESVETDLRSQLVNFLDSWQDCKKASPGIPLTFTHTWLNELLLWF